MILTISRTPPSLLLVEELPVALVSAAQVLELPEGRRPGTDYPIVVISDRGQRFAVVVEEFLGERDLEVRPLDPRLGKVADVSSASVLENGWPVLIIDVEDLVRSIDNLLGGRRLHRVGTEIAEDAAVKPAKRVLVVDDSITVRRVTQRLLERNGMRVLTARDGMDAVALLADNLPDVILLDIEMPRMDGYEVAAHVRNDAPLQDIPIIMITSRVGEKHRARAIELGVDDYLGKPYQESQLIDAINPLVAERRKSRRASGA